MRAHNTFVHLFARWSISTFGVHPSTPQLLSWLLSPTLRLWLRACWAMRWVPPLTLGPLWPLSPAPLLHPDLTGGMWRTLTCLSSSTRSPLPLMRLCPNTSSPLLAPVPWSSPLPSHMLATGSMAFHLPPWVSTCRTRSSAAASAIGWEFPFTALPRPYSCPECHCVADVFGDHQVGGNGDRINAIRDVIFCAAQSAACLHPKRCPTSSWTPSLDLQMSFCQRGAVAALQQWMCTSSVLSSSRPSLRLPTLLATLCRWECNGSWHPTSQLAVRQGLTSSPLWLRLWVVWRRTPSQSSEGLVTSSVSVLDRAHPVLLHAANNFFTV